MLKNLTNHNPSKCTIILINFAFISLNTKLANKLSFSKYEHTFTQYVNTFVGLQQFKNGIS